VKSLGHADKVYQNHAAIKKARAKQYSVRNEALEKARAAKLEAISRSFEERTLEVSREFELKDKRTASTDKAAQFEAMAARLRSDRENRFKLKDQRIANMKRAQEYDHEVRMFKVKERDMKLEAYRKAQETLKAATIKEVQKSQRLQEDLRAKFTKLRSFANRPNVFMRKIQEMDIPLPKELFAKAPKPQD